MKLSIAIAGLLWQDSGDVPYLTPQVISPNLDKLIRRATIKPLSLKFSDLMYAGFSHEGSFATQLAASLGHTKLYKNFLIAEPSFLRVDRDRLLICESELLQLDDTETSTIIKHINDHFKGEITIFPVETNLWLIGLNQNTRDTDFYPLIDIIGENIDDYLPQNNVELTKLLNEIQMLLFNLKLNKQRKSEGLLQINTLWLWDKTLSADLTASYSHIFTTGQSINNAKIKPLPKLIPDAFIDNSLIIVDSLYYSCCYRDSYSYLNNLATLDNQIISLLLSYRKQIDKLDILIPGSSHSAIISLTKNDKYKFWKNMAFTHFLKEQHAC